MPRPFVRLLVLPVLLAGACASSNNNPGPQEARFPAGQRVVHGGGLTLELSEARYDLREVVVTVSLTNEGDAPVALERQGVLLAYDQLEFPVAESSDPGLADRTTLAPGASTALVLRFVIEQPLLEAATLHLLSIRRGDEGWLEPLRMAVPPPLAYVEAAEPPPDE